MRLIIDTLICLMLVAILAGAVWHYNRQQADIRLQQAVHAARARIQNQVIYRGALEEVPINEAGFPVSISPSWFADGLPVNPLVPRTQPWLDIAPADDLNDHPPDPIIRDTGQAGFWYNPSRGLVRVRVLPMHTEQATVDMYNQLNGSNMLTLRDPTPRELHLRMPQVVREPTQADDQPHDDRQTLASPRKPTMGTVILNTNSPHSPSIDGTVAAGSDASNGSDFAPTQSTSEPRRTLADAPTSN